MRTAMLTSVICWEKRELRGDAKFYSARFFSVGQGRPCPQMFGARDVENNPIGSTVFILRLHLGRRGLVEPAAVLLDAPRGLLQVLDDEADVVQADEVLAALVAG